MGYFRVLPDGRREGPGGRWLGFVVSHPCRSPRVAAASAQGWGTQFVFISRQGRNKGAPSATRIMGSGLLSASLAQLRWLGFWRVHRCVQFACKLAHEGTPPNQLFDSGAYVRFGDTERQGGSTALSLRPGLLSHQTRNFLKDDLVENRRMIGAKDIHFHDMPICVGSDTGNAPTHPKRKGAIWAGRLCRRTGQGVKVDGRCGIAARADHPLTNGHPWS